MWHRLPDGESNPENPCHHCPARDSPRYNTDVIRKAIIALLGLAALACAAGWIGSVYLFGIEYRWGAGNWLGLAGGTLLWSFWGERIVDLDGWSLSPPVSTLGEPVNWYTNGVLRVVYLPLWIPLVIFAAYPTFAFIRGPLRRWRRRCAGHCVRCGYDLTGNESGVCPECGRPVLRSGRNALLGPILSSAGSFYSRQPVARVVLGTGVFAAALAVQDLTSPTLGDWLCDVVSVGFGWHRGVTWSCGLPHRALCAFLTGLVYTPGALVGVWVFIGRRSIDPPPRRSLLIAGCVFALVFFAFTMLPGWFQAEFYGIREFLRLFCLEFEWRRAGQLAWWLVRSSHLILSFWVACAACGLFSGRGRRLEYPFCSRCRYNLTGNESGVCPECGTPT